MGTNIDKFLASESIKNDANRGYAYKDLIDLVYGAYHGGLSKESVKVLMRRGMKPTNKPNQYNFTRDRRLEALHVRVRV